jgi:hypothetical protein
VQLPPVVAGAHPLPVIIITPPPQPAAQVDREYPRLEAIPEEEEGDDPLVKEDASWNDLGIEQFQTLF